MGNLLQNKTNICKYIGKDNSSQVNGKQKYLQKIKNYSYKIQNKSRKDG